MNTSQNPKTDEPRKLTPTERLHDLAMAAITKPSRHPSDEISVSQMKTGPHVKQWVCDSLLLVPMDGETPMQYAARTLDVAKAMQVGLNDLNAQKLTDELDATLNQKVKR